MSIAYEFEVPASNESWEAEAFMESVAEAARTGRRYRPLALAAMAAARAALSQGRIPDVESELEGALEGLPAASTAHPWQHPRVMRSDSTLVLGVGCWVGKVFGVRCSVFGWFGLRQSLSLEPCLLNPYFRPSPSFLLP